MKFAAIDIGSNAVRLQIARPLQEASATSPFKVVEFTRLPLRLGDEVFNDREISRKKAELLKKAMQAFALLMEIYNVDGYRACATSAMRDATNSKKIIRDIKKDSGIKIDVITGKEESQLIQKGIIDLIPPGQDMLHVDVGGGSTEITLLRGGIPKVYESFNIGTVRMREGKVRKPELKRMHAWLDEVMVAHDVKRALGTGGNIVKLLQLSGAKPEDSISVDVLKETTEMVKRYSLHDRIYHLNMNPDRAEVVEYAGSIFVEILQSAGIEEIQAPNKGLKDGIIRQLWQEYLKNNPGIVPEDMPPKKIQKNLFPL